MKKPKKGSIKIVAGVVYIYNGWQYRSTEGIERNRMYVRKYHANGQLNTTVPAKIKALAVKQADTEGLNMSAFLGNILVMYLQDCGTKIEA